MSLQLTAKRYAVIVGINDYSGTDINNLNFCGADAVAFYEALIHYSDYSEDDVWLFSDVQHNKAERPTNSDILSKIQLMCDKATEEDSILFYFAGHGTSDENDSFLITKEYRENILKDSSIPMNKVNEYFSASVAKFKLRFFDACHSGRMMRRTGNLIKPVLEKHLIVGAEGWATLAACKEDQFAHEFGELGHGIFSYFLVKGLSGSATIDGEFVTLDNLKNYVMDKTIELSKRYGYVQTPVFTGEQAGSLAISRVKGKDVSEALPESLTNIEQIKEEKLEPQTEKIQDFLGELDKVLNVEHGSVKYIAKSQTDKLNIIKELITDILKWAEGKTGELIKRADSGVKVVNIGNVPNAAQVAEFLYNKTEDALEVEYYCRKIDESGRYHDIYALNLKERNTNNTVILTFGNGTLLIPNSYMVISPIPSTTGVYLLIYFGSTKPGYAMTEIWEPATFSPKRYYHLSIDKKPNEIVINDLEQLFVEYISFISESIIARRVYFERIGLK
ncbi:caspase family protein [Brevibacillus dissolubilis]|uniref:caspase family protein n=1 Tax=Brevibacillus dissolubilis TaxID=1844116 RepID=UPI00159BC604|nr:caspase family protein [Brevibacillus dissolubilis]